MDFAWISVACVKPISVSARCVFGERGRSANDFDAKNSFLFLDPPVEGDVGPAASPDVSGVLLFDAAVVLLSEAALPGLSLSLSLSEPLESPSLLVSPGGGACTTFCTLVAGLVLAVSLSLPEEEEDDDDESDDDELDIFARLSLRLAAIHRFQPEPVLLLLSTVGKQRVEPGGCARGRGAPPGLAGGAPRAKLDPPDECGGRGTSRPRSLPGALRPTCPAARDARRRVGARRRAPVIMMPDS